MRATYRVLSGLIALAVVFQAAAVAFGTFGVINEVEGGAVVTSDSDLPNAGPMLHGIGGMMVIPLLVLVLLVVSFFARVRGGVKWAALLLLAVALQIALGFAAFEAPAVGLLHGANAFVILALAVVAARAAAGPAAAAAETTGDAARV
jgi:heme A synthase